MDQKQILIIASASIITLLLIICMQRRCFFKRLNAKVKFSLAARKNNNYLLHCDTEPEDIGHVGDMIVVQTNNGLVLYNS